MHACPQSLLRLAVTMTMCTREAVKNLLWPSGLRGSGVLEAADSRSSHLSFAHTPVVEVPTCDIRIKQDRRPQGL